MSSVAIVKADAVNLERALLFVQRMYKEKFNTEPTELWPDCLVALSEGEVVGVTAMQFSEGERFEVEEQFYFNADILPVKRGEIVSFGKWVTSRVDVAAPLVLAAAKYSLGLGKKRTLSCAKPNLIEFLRIKHKLAVDVFNVGVNLGNIPEEDRNFFITLPTPQVYSGDLRQWYDTLVQGVSTSVEIRL